MILLKSIRQSAELSNLMITVSAVQSHSKSWTQHVVDYVRLRQNSDYGYTFCLGAESNLQDTYYGLAILNLLGASFPEAEKTMKWISDFKLHSVYNHYYANKARLLCGKPLNYLSREFVESLINSNQYFGGHEYFLEAASEFEFTLIVIELANMLSLKFNIGGVKEWLLQAQNKDGGFGVHKHSAIDSTYHAVAALKQLNFNVKNLSGTVEFIRSCEKPCGGSTIIPSSVTIYLENTYYGIMTLDLFGERERFSSQTKDFIMNSQKANGGFARSETGIATFQNTFQAMKLLKKLGAS